MKMRYKLFGILVVLFFMGIVAITVYLNLREGRQYLDTEISSRVKIAEAIIRTWHAVMLFTGSDTLAREQFLNVQTENGLLSIKLARNENLTRINPGSSPYVSTELEKQVITEGKPAFEILAKNSHSDRRLLTLVPIKAQPACIQCHQEVSHHHIKEGEVMAVISLITSLKVVDSQIASDRAATAFSLLGIFLVTLVISFLTVKRFTRPITKLTQASEAIAAGEFEVRVPTTSKGELGILENAFNLMVKRVKESKEALEAYSERLEEEVAERTQALQSALKESRQRQTEISALLEGSRTVLDTRDFQNAAQALFDSCKNLIGATAGYTAVLSKDGTANEVLFLDSGGRACAVDPSLPMPIRGLRAEAYGTGKAVYHNDFTKSEWVQYMPEGHVTLDNVLFAPLTIKGEVVGLFGLANKPGGFTENDARVASAFGELAAITLHDSQMLQSLENSEERFRSVAQTASDGIITTDSRGNIVFWNRAAETIFGHSADEAVGQPLTLIMPERFHQAHQGGMKQVISTGESNVIGKRVEVVGLRKDGTEFPLELSLTTWKTGEGVFFTGIVRDITERKRAEEALRDSKEFVETVFNSTNESISVINTTNYTIKKVNKAFLNLLNMHEKDVIGKYCYEVTHQRSKPCEPPNDTCPLVETVKTGSFASAEHLHYDKEGKKIYVEVATSPIRNDKDEIRQVVHFARDITERKQAEEALRKSEEKYRLVIENANEVIIVVQDGKMKFVNPKTMEITGYSEEQLTTKPFVEFIYPEDRKMVAERYQRRLRGEEIPHIYSFRIVDKEGNIKWLDINAVRIFWEERPATLNFLSDITERKQAEEALRQSEEKYRTLFEESMDAIFLSTPEGKFLDINPAGVQLFGHSSKEELLQVDIARDLYFNPKDREAFQNALEEHGFVKDYELVLKRKDGEKLFVLETATAVRDSNGKIVAYRGIIHDLTERKQLEEQLLQAQKMETIGTLAGGVAHDFNNLLTVILGNAEFGLQDTNPSDPVYPELIRIEKAASQARDLTSQLLTFSRRQVLKPKLLNLNRTIEEVLKMLKRIIGEDIELKTELASELAPVWADPGQVQQVLMNLCVNARDAMPRGGQLVLKTRNLMSNQIKGRPQFKKNSRNYVELTITDTGRGMDKETQARVFEPFFTTKEVGQGTGLGLSVVYGIVKQHDGHIEVSSQVGKGTTFRIYFPSVTEPEATEKRKKKSPDVLKGSETILVVEDDEAVRNVDIRILEGLGYRVLTANDGMQAVQQFEAESDKVDLVIMDVVLPKLGGAEAYKRMRTIQPNLSVVFVTGHDVKAELGHLEHKDIRLLQKPYTKETLGAMVRELLDN